MGVVCSCYTGVLRPDGWLSCKVNTVNSIGDCGNTFRLLHNTEKHKTPKNISRVKKSMLTGLDLKSFIICYEKIPSGLEFQ